MKTSTSSQPTTRQHPALGPVLLLVLALLWAQMFGLAHRVLHTPHPSGAALWQKLGATNYPGVATAGLLEHLLSPAQGEPECRAYDQLGVTDVLPVPPVLVLPALLPPVLEISSRAMVCLSRISSFEARGPPTVR
jgi:hypothetical protein